MSFETSTGAAALRPLGRGSGPDALRRQLRDVLVCTAVAAVAASLVVLVVPRGGDLAAHLYRTALVRHGILVWDNLWFGGDYPLSSYSLLYYLLAAVVGNTPLGIAGVVASAAIFASIAQREWGGAGRWPARVFAVLLSGQAFTGAYPFDLGLAMLLGTLWALQRRRNVLAVCCTLLTLGFSPLAFLFLGLLLVALFLRLPRVSRQAVVVGGAAAIAGSVQLALLVVLPTPGLVYPYGTWQLLVGLAVAALGIAVSLRSRASRPVALVFLVWAAASIVFAAVPSPVGRNLARVSVFAFPLVLAAGALGGFRPRWLTITAGAAALAANVLPYTAMIPARSANASSHAAFWRPIIGFLQTHEGSGFRVEVVQTNNHWENYYLPRAGIALARGWYIQLDIADNPVLYRRGLTGARYRAWLRSRAVRYVVLPNIPDEAAYGRQEVALLRSGRSGLREVWNSPQGTVYELPHAKPLLTGPGRATIRLLRSSRIEGRVSRPGDYLLRSRFNPYWTVTRGSVCLAKVKGGATEVHARRAGPFTIKAIESPGALLAAMVEGDSSTCAHTSR